MYVIHSIETYATWTMKRAERIENENAKTDKRKFAYAYALGYACKALGVKHRDDSDAHDIVQAAYLLWHKSRVGKRVRLDTRGACRFAVRNYWRAKHAERIKGNADDATNPNGKYVNATISTARMNNMSYVQTSDGIPDKMTRNLDLQTVDMEQSDTTITMVVRMLSTGATQRDIANHTDMSEMQVSRVIARLRDMGTEYWGVRKQGETIPLTPLVTIPYRAPKHYKPIVVATNNEQTVSDHTPIRISECRYSAQWRDYAEHIRNSPTLDNGNVDNWGYTENDIAQTMPMDDDFLERIKIIYS